LTIPMPPRLVDEAIALVDRAYAAFDSMFQGLRDELALRREKTEGPKRTEPPAAVLAASSPASAQEPRHESPPDKTENPWGEAAPL
ncbi:MAG: hypothetical protein ACJ8AT_18390, partial [Hyalangium sp.]